MEDLISRQVVLDLLNTAKEQGIKQITTLYLEGIIKQLPSVTPQPKTGHWITYHKGIYTNLICNKCFSNAPYDCRTDYCPNCGAKMIEPQESEEE